MVIPRRWSSFAVLMLALAIVVAGCGAENDSETEPPSTASNPTPTILAPTETPVGTSSQASSNDTPTSEPRPDPTEDIANASEPELTATPQPTVTDQPAVVSSGSFESIGYEGAGTVLALQQQNGSYVIQFSDDFSVENGPALVIYLSTTTDLSDGGVLASDYIDLGPLQATEGFQEYALPADADPADWASVIVWCEEFDVGFVGALLGAS